MFKGFYIGKRDEQTGAHRKPAVKSCQALTSINALSHLSVALAVLFCTVRLAPKRSEDIEPATTKTG
ncbi:hypothetical protein TSAR_014020 [Trichomalopsis sarcophagae]|uniref:Uncharacterized protein n=1 Tax=Trichomalopsis sarcophagae TaxID=543379 RepID=A0A232F0T0_9HYME|nr:hypothetical protein TSAR_014020 [Trichomalopsis sarcophagae]